MLCEKHMIERGKKIRNYYVDKQKLESVFYFKKKSIHFPLEMRLRLKKVTKVTKSPQKSYHFNTQGTFLSQYAWIVKVTISFESDSARVF